MLLLSYPRLGDFDFLKAFADVLLDLDIIDMDILSSQSSSSSPSSIPSDDDVEEDLEVDEVYLDDFVL